MERSYLFVPATTPELLPKALRSAADVVVVDLEDSVPAGEKAAARERLPALLASATSARPAKPVHLRINPLRSAAAERDLEVLDPRIVTALRIPKVESGEAVLDLDESLSRLESACGVPSGATELFLTIESAAGVMRLETLDFSRLVRTCRLVFGEADYLADIRASSEELARYARIRVVLHSRASGLPAPVDGAFTRLDDEPGLAASCRSARALGFGGKSAIHPRQLGAINALFGPSAPEIERARRIVEHYRKTVAQGRGATTLPETGEFIDEAVARSAMQLLESIHTEKGPSPT